MDSEKPAKSEPRIDHLSTLGGHGESEGARHRVVSAPSYPLYSDEQEFLNQALMRAAERRDARRGMVQEAWSQEALAKANDPDRAPRSDVYWYGVLAQPLDFYACSQMPCVNPHLGSCVEAIASAMVGQGLTSKDTQKRLDKLAGKTPMDTIYSIYKSAAKDYELCGACYIEVSYDQKLGEINGFFWIPAHRVHKYLEQESPKGSGRQHFHYLLDYIDGLGPQGEFTSGYATPDGVTKRLAPFGQRDRCRQLEDFNGQTVINELIEIAMPTNLWEHYGGPAWLGAMPHVELMKLALQQRSDLYYNRGVVDFIISFLGISLSDAQWQSVQSCLGAASGAGNQGKSAAFNFPNIGPDSKVEVHPLAATSSSSIEGFAEIHDTTAMAVCSAFRTPLVIAGVTMAGKMGAANETVQAMIHFEMFKIKQQREHFETVWNNTVGTQDPTLRIELKSPIDDMDMFALDTAANSRGEAARQPNRDFSKGKKTSGHSNVSK